MTHLATDALEPALRPRFTVDEIDGCAVVTAEVDEVAVERKPCFYKQDGLPKGAYLRVGNTNRQMGEYEVFGYLMHGQPRFDEDIVPRATVDDLDPVLLIATWRTCAAPGRGLPARRPRRGAGAAAHRGPRRPGGAAADAGRALGVRQVSAGVLPAAYNHLRAILRDAREEETPRGERFVDNRRFEGPIPEMIETAESYVMGALRKSSLIEGTRRGDIPEYPDEALREAMVNAVAHRDYSDYVRGSYIQVRLFADRSRSRAPADSMGNVTVDRLENEQSTRNVRLMRLLEDVHVVENRGSGIRGMLQAMRDANLEPPRFDDRRSRSGSAATIPC